MTSSTISPKHQISAADKQTGPLFDVQCSVFNVQCSQLIPHYIQRHIHAAHLILGPELKQLSIALVGDKKMSDLHLQFLNIPGPTDVLTFPLEMDPAGRPLSGEVVICVPEAKRQCKKTHQTLRKELLLYALHGLLHLCGFDDKNEPEFRRMHRMEDKILRQLGVGAVFKPGDRGAD